MINNFNDVTHQARGFSAIGLFHPERKHNIGAVSRACNCFDVSFLAIEGRDFARTSADTMKYYRHNPVLQVGSLKDVVPYDCVPVAIEIVAGAESLVTYKHPERAFYIFGPESSSLGRNVTEWCRDVVYIPTARCLNLAASVNIVLYDRLIKNARKDQRETSRDNTLVRR